MKQQMCSARPSWKSISLQNLTYKDRLYKVKLVWQNSKEIRVKDATNIQIDLLKQLFQIVQIHINLSNIISLDTTKQMVKVEPMVSIGILNDYLIRLGWTVPVVPELDDLTIGGLVMGGGIETTSHK